MGTCLKNLTCISTVKPQGKISQTISNRKVRLLGQAFSNLKRLSSGLATLNLTVEGEVRSFPNKMSIHRTIPTSELTRAWTTTAAAWRGIATALGQSALSIRKLDIYGSGPSYHRITIDQFAAIMKDTSLSACFAHLEHLSLSISPPAPKISDTVGMHYPLAASKRNTEAVCQFLETCPKLRSLDLRWNGIKDHRLSEGLNEEARIFSRIADSTAFSALREVNLRGIRTQEKVLLAFLRGKPLKNVIIYDIILRPGKFRAVFNLFSGADLDHLHLDSLWDEEGIVSFTSTSHGYGPYTLVRCGEGASKHIVYHSSRAKSMARRPPAREACTSFTEWNR